METESLQFVFVVGCQRSGTTLLGQMLGAQPRAVLIDEDTGVYPLLDALLLGSPSTGEILRRCLATARAAYTDGARFDAPDGSLGDITHIILKAPNATYDVARLRSLRRTGLHVVFAVRDVRDVVCSMQRLPHVPMVANQLARLERHPELATRFGPQIEVCRRPGSSAHVARAVIWMIKSSLHPEFVAPPLAASLVRYEDLVGEPAKWIARLLEHVGLANGDRPREHTSVLRGIGPGLTARERSVDQTSVGRWRRQLTAAEEEDVWQLAGPLMEELGYLRCGSRAPAPRPAIAPESLAQPVIAVGRGGSGTRLLSMALRGQGVFLGNDLNDTEDSVEWVTLIYELAIKRLIPALDPETHRRRELRALAAGILGRRNLPPGQPWGWKLPETMLVLVDALSAFPAARIVHLVRHPVACSLRRDHMTSRTDNELGRLTLRAAYRELGWDRDPAGDASYLRNAASWLFQVAPVVKLGRSLGSDRYLEIKFEDLCAGAQLQTDRIAAFLGRPPRVTDLPARIDPSRQGQASFPPDAAREVWSICGRVGTQLGYRFEAASS